MQISKLFLSILILSISVNVYAYKKASVPAGFQEMNAYITDINFNAWSIIRDTLTFKHYRGTLKANDQQHGGEYLIKFDFYQTKNTRYQKAPLIVYVPPMKLSDNINQLNDLIPTYFTKKGYHLLLVHVDEDFIEDTVNLDKLDNYLVRNNVAIMQAIDFFTSQSEFSFIDKDKIAAFSISMGAIRMPYLLAADPRILRGVIIMGGGGVSNILATSNMPRIVNFRQKIMKEEGYRYPEEFVNHVRRYISYENTDIAPYIDRNRVRMVISLLDKIVPTFTQDNLWRALNKPKRLKSLSGHYTIVLDIQRVLRFSYKSYRDIFR